MSVTAAIVRQNEIWGIVDGHNGLFAKYPANPNFARLTNLKTAHISPENGQYNAFPYFIKLGSSLVGIYAEGAAHAQSDRHIMARSDDGGVTWSRVTFFENSTGVFDLSLLSGLIPDGGTAIFKVWTVKNTGGVLSVTSVSSVSDGVTSYAIWGHVEDNGGTLYRTAYGANKVALLRSSDGGVTWVFHSVIANQAGLLLSEASLTFLTSTSVVCFIREDSGANNPIYKVISSDGGLTWSAPALQAGLTGRQPKVTKLNSTPVRYALTTGKRTGGTGQSGLDEAYFSDRTGVAMWLFDVNLANQTLPYQLATMYSTDGGQPWACEMSAGRLFVPYYARRSVERLPDLLSIQLDCLGSM